MNKYRIQHGESAAAYDAYVKIMVATHKLIKGGLLIFGCL